MLAPISRACTEYLELRMTNHGDWRTFYEIGAREGVVDVLLARLEPEVLEERVRCGLGVLPDFNSLLVLNCWPARRQSFSAPEIAQWTGLSPSWISAAVMPLLLSSGYVTRVNRSEWGLLYEYKNPFRTFVAIEAKQRAWRSALGQAIRYTRFANRTYVALTGTFVNPALRSSSLFERSNIGLLAVRPGGEFEACTDQLIPASRSLRLSIIHRAFVAERSAELLITNRCSGPIRPVFGRRLVALEGEDPRLAQ